MDHMKPNMAHKIPLKRERNEREKKTDSDSEYERFVTWPRFLVVKSASVEASLHKLSPFAIQKGFQAIAEPSRARRDCGISS